MTITEPLPGKKTHLAVLAYVLLTAYQAYTGDVPVDVEVVKQNLLVASISAFRAALNKVLPR